MGLSLAQIELLAPAGIRQEANRHRFRRQGVARKVFRGDVPIQNTAEQTEPVRIHPDMSRACRDSVELIKNLAHVAILAEKRRQFDPEGITQHAGLRPRKHLTVDVKAKGGERHLRAAEKRRQPAPGDPVEANDPLLTVQNQLNRRLSLNRGGRDRRSPQDDIAHRKVPIERSAKVAHLGWRPAVFAREGGQGEMTGINVVEERRDFHEFHGLWITIRDAFAGSSTRPAVRARWNSPRRRAIGGDRAPGPETFGANAEVRGPITMNLSAQHGRAARPYGRLLQVGAVENPDYKPGDPATYPIGKCDITDQSLPTGYYLEGWLISPLVVGRRVEVLRLSRNGVPSLGLFTSSTVVELDPDGFRTRNSLYRMTVVKIPAVPADGNVDQC